MTDEEAGVADAVWERWNESKQEHEYEVREREVVVDDGSCTIQFLSPLGRGVSGAVYTIRIKEYKTSPQIENMLYALKIFYKDQISISQGMNEANMLAFIHRTFNTSKVTTFPSYLQFFKISGYIAILMELGGPNLYQAIQMKKHKGFPLSSCKNMLCKLLMPLAEMENKGLVHGDIKPENILISMRRFGAITSFKQYKNNLQQISAQLIKDDYDAPGSLDVLLVDWSSASIGYNQPAPYMQSLFYRAPEILMRSTYGPLTDIWSTACVAAELFLGQPLFPGKDELDMLRIIQQRLGIFPLSVVKKMGADSVAKSCEDWKIDPSTYAPGNFEAFIREVSGREDTEILTFINILRLMLQLNQDARVTASSALIHPFITGTIDRRSKQRRESAMPLSGPGVVSVNARRRSVRGANAAPKNLF